MQKIKLVVSIIFIGSFYLSGCSGIFAEPTATPTITPDRTATAEVGAVTETQEAISSEETQAVVATEEKSIQLTGTSEAVQAAIETQRAERKLLATEEASSIYNEVQSLYEDGYLTSTGGEYQKLPSFSESWAQLQWFSWWPTDFEPTDFVISTTVEWDTASNTSDWFSTGCGFVFRADDHGNNYYVIFLTLDGFAEIMRNSNSNLISLGRSYYGRLDTPSGTAELVLTMQGSTINIFVNGEHVISRTDKRVTDGYLAHTLLSGTNKDYGTKCTFKNTSLWELD